MRLEPAAPQSGVKHSTAEPLCNLGLAVLIINILFANRKRSVQNFRTFTVIQSQLYQTGWMILPVLNMFMLSFRTACRLPDKGSVVLNVCQSQVCVYDTSA